jgi:hypothetical protein
MSQMSILLNVVRGLRIWSFSNHPVRRLLPPDYFSRSFLLSTPPFAVGIASGSALGDTNALDNGSQSEWEVEMAVSGSR